MPVWPFPRSYGHFSVFSFAKNEIPDVTGAAKLAKFIANNTTDENYDVSADGTTGVLTYTANKGGVVSTSGSGPDAAPTAVTVAVAKGASGATTPDISIAASPTVVTAGAEATEATITADTTTLDADAIKTVVDGIDGVSDGKVTVEMNATSKKLELKVGNTVIGTSDEAVDGVKSEFTFKGSDADTTALGTIKFSSAPTEAAGVNFKSGLSYTASVTSNEPPADDPNAEETATVPSGPISVGGVDLTQKADAIAEADLKKIEKAFSEIGSNGKIVLNGDVEIDLSKVTEGLTADSSKYQDLLNNIPESVKFKTE